MPINTSLLTWYMCLHAQLLQSYPTVCDSMDHSLPGSSVHGIFQARILEWVAISSARGFSWPRDQIQVFCVSCIAGRFFTTEPLGKPNLAHGHLSINSLLLFCYYQCHCLGVLPKPFWVNKRKCLSAFCILHIGRAGLTQVLCAGKIIFRVFGETQSLYSVFISSSDDRIQTTVLWTGLGGNLKRDWSCYFQNHPFSPTSKAFS